MVPIPGTIGLWKYRRIPYEFERGYPYQNEVRKAMDKWENAASVSFVLRHNEDDYLFIQNRASKPGSSAIGMQGGAQDVYIEAGFKSLRELGHALGLIREHGRSDLYRYTGAQDQGIIHGKRIAQFQGDIGSQNPTRHDPTFLTCHPARTESWKGDLLGDPAWPMSPESKSEPFETGESAQSILTKYLDMPVPMGIHTASGSWKHFYAVQFPFNIGNQQFLYAQNLKGKNWFIQKLLAGGKMGMKTDHGSWKHAYAVQFPFMIGNRVFFYGTDFDGASWFIQELPSGGKMGHLETDRGSRAPTYAVQFPFTVGGRVFLYGNNLAGRDWFIQELLPGGKMGRKTREGRWRFAYNVQFPFEIGGRVFFYGQSLVRKLWFIQELLPEGNMGRETDHGFWDEGYDVQFPYSIGNNQYFYGQSQATNCWFIRRLQADGKMGDELQRGSWSEFYPVNFPFAIGGIQYFYRQGVSGTYSIQQLVDVS
ncbi:hypothetical protein F5Y10DRAFT_284916 [Nemania abortiva]|nr:hypothetical protein F5Y10DRAFT_284916 [Nemania abortiva]